LSSREAPVFVRFLKNLNFLDKFLKILKHEISRKSVQWGGAVPCGETNGLTNAHNEADSRFSKFCERAQKAAIVLKILQINDRPKLEFLKSAS
jgi:hypothetical protein